MRKLFVLMALMLCLTVPAWSATTTTTTVTANITSSQTTIPVGSATGFTAGSTFAFIGQEEMDVTSVTGTTIGVRRGSGGTVAQAHNSGETVYVGPSTAFVSWPTDPVGRCTSTNYAYLPLINTRTGSIISCSSSRFTAISVLAGVQTPIGSQPFTINSRDYLNSGDNIGFQVKPNQAVANTSQIRGGEISPRCASGIACAGVVGLHLDATLKGTASGNITSDVRGLELEMISDDGGTRAITGNVSGIRIRSAFSAASISGKFVPIRIEYPETQTNSKTYDAVMELTGTVSLVWNNDPGTEVSGSIKGYFAMLINGTKRYVATYDTAPTD